MKLFTIVPNWNGAKYLGESLQSLRRQSLPSQIVVVDNGSRDESAELVEKQFPEVDLIGLGHNRGFAGGANAGLRHALDNGADLLALLNNDAVAEGDWLQQLAETARTNPRAGVVTGKFLLWDRTTIDSTGDFVSSWGFSFPRGRGEPDSGQYDSPPYEIFGATGGASLFRATTLEQIGLFDEDFFAYLEDVDLSFRAQLAGWKVLYEPKAVAYHRMWATSSRVIGTSGRSLGPPAAAGTVTDFARFHNTKNIFFLFTKNMPADLWWRYLPRFSAGIALTIGSSVRRGQVIVTARALLAVVRRLPAMLRRRRRIQASRQVDSNYIDGLVYHRLPPTIRTFASLRGRISRFRVQ